MKPKLLLVDDEEGIRKVLGISLADSGYSVLTAENGEEALRVFDHEQPDIVLTDIKMPGMDGISLLRRLKQRNPETEVIMITGHGDMDLAIKSLQYDATDFVTKPISDDALEKSLQKARENILIRRKLKEYTENLESLVHEKTARLQAVANPSAPKASGAQQAPDPSRYQKLFDDMPCYISVRDRHYRLTAANKLFRQDFGEPGAACCYELCKQAAGPCEDCPVDKTFHSGSPQQAEMVFKPQTGASFNTLVWTTPVRDAHGEITHVLVMATNITLLSQLQDHLASLGLMIGSVSHAIKGMLTGLDGGMYMIDSGFAHEDQTQVQEGWEVVKLMVGRIRGMVLDILYQAKERAVVRTPVDLAVFAEDLAGVIAPKMKRHGIRLVQEFAPGLGRFELDAGQVQAALVNILENAVDACLEDRQKTEHQVVFRVRREPQQVVFEVEDNGIGMDADTRAGIFALFASSKADKGTGLGLFVAAKIVHQHEGEITVASTPGEGSCFTVRLPAVGAEPGGPSTNTPEDQAA
jgi:signal transduction histidine kinase/FixJ family two-component response regulator